MSKIDFVWVSTPVVEIADQKVFLDSHHTLGCDHRAVFASCSLPYSMLKQQRRQRRAINKCGRWRVDCMKLQSEAQALAEQLGPSIWRFGCPTA